MTASLTTSMHTIGPLENGFDINSMANIALMAASRFWFAVAVVGQLLFVYYIVSFYGHSALHGDFVLWNKILPKGYIPGDTMGNLAVAIHLFLAVVVTFGGPLQLLPQLRTRMPFFHRVNGRVYIFAAFMISITGLQMVWGSGNDGFFIDPAQHLGITLNAILIMIFAVVTVSHAVKGRTANHHRWALRLFMVVSGVWFFRIGLMLWIYINDGPAEFDPKTFEGPVIVFLNFAQYLLPLIVLELYLLCKAKANAVCRMVMASTLLLMTAVMGSGITLAFVGLWLPHI